MTTLTDTSTADLHDEARHLRDYLDFHGDAYDEAADSAVRRLDVITAELRRRRPTGERHDHQRVLRVDRFLLDKYRNHDGRHRRR